MDNRTAPAAPATTTTTDNNQPRKTPMSTSTNIAGKEGEEATIERVPTKQPLVHNVIACVTRLVLSGDVEEHSMLHIALTNLINDCEKSSSPKVSVSVSGCSETHQTDSPPSHPQLSYHLPSLVSALTATAEGTRCGDQVGQAASSVLALARAHNQKGGQAEEDDESEVANTSGSTMTQPGEESWFDESGLEKHRAQQYDPSEIGKKHEMIR